MILSVGLGLQVANAATEEMEEGGQTLLNPDTTALQITSKDSGISTMVGIKQEHHNDVTITLGDGQALRTEAWDVLIDNKSNIKRLEIQKNTQQHGGDDKLSLIGDYNVVDITDEGSTTTNNGKVNELLTDGAIVNTGVITTATGRTIINASPGEMDVLRGADVTNRGKMTTEPGSNINSLLNDGTLVLKGSAVNISNSKTGKITSDGGITETIYNDGEIKTEDTAALYIEKALKNNGLMAGTIVGTTLEISNDGTSDINLAGEKNQKVDLSGITITNNRTGEWRVRGDFLKETGVYGCSSFTNYGTIISMTDATNGGLYTNMTNAGTIDIRDNALTIKGTYNGTGDALIKTAGGLEGDDSKIHVLTIEKTVAGKTKVEVTNLGGMGGETPDGIPVIKSL
ncbi:hypothetical protein EXO80_26480, partial [Salmonella enterica]|nr:hypothetical protein [Salmonella enterica]ECH1726115.1 hypothetical protein [Salmonella enterica]